MAVNGGISSLVDNIVGTIAGFFGPPKNTQGAYPTNGAIGNVLANINESNWNLNNNNYSFSVIDITNPGGTSGFAGFTDFPLPINPSDISQDENFAIRIIPTQGGTVVTHAGNKYADLTISGTTGLFPFKGAGGATRAGKAIAQPNDLQHKSGFFVFLTLRNWFRAYYEAKKSDPQTYGNGRLVFRNFKDGDFLLVDLIRFGMKRSASRPHLYDYNLVFKVLGHVPPPPKKDPTFLQQLDQTLADAFDTLDTARGILLRTQDILRQVEANIEAVVINPLRQINLILKAAIGLGNSVGDLQTRFIGNFTTVGVAIGILNYVQQQQQQQAQQASVNPNAPFNNVSLPSNIPQAAANNPVQAVMNLKDALTQIDIKFFPVAAQNELIQEKQQLQDLPRQFFTDTYANLIRVRDNAADKFGLGDPVYDAEFNRTPTLSADPGHVVTDDEFSVLQALDGALKAINLYIQNGLNFKSSYADRIANLESNFGNNLPDIQVASASRQITLDAGITLERLALRELGDEARWPEIVEMNDLKPPYIIQDMSDTTPNVLHPGQSILIPAPIVNGFATTTTNESLPINQGLTEVEKNLGIDFAVDKNFDLIFTNQGDLQVAVAAQNAAQAIILKLSYEKGDLIKHPEVGVDLAVGTKGSPLSLLKTSIINSITADPRFDSVEDINIERIDDSIQVSFVAYAKSVDTPIPVTLRF